MNKDGSGTKKGKKNPGKKVGLSNSHLNHNVNEEVTSVTKIKLSDKGSPRHAVILNPLKENHVKRRMDGGFIKNSTAADWMLSKPGTGDIFLELKGGDVSRAVEQISATADFAVKNNLICGKIGALILCTEHPGFNTKMQRIMQAFATKFKGPIHARNRSGEFVFEHILSFNGPERI
ncbi:hypothetical protein [Xanthomonas campestris]|uniref:hypothetical protein n=1 Tax=Xanthomonas campestris TaxID=339 RepID=UPI0023E95C16|nr:hypothetical protein [Xanthomonas campestris]